MRDRRHVIVFATWIALMAGAAGAARAQQYPLQGSMPEGCPQVGFLIEATAASATPSGTGVSDVMIGAGGNDALGTGNDRLHGAAGADRISGGFGRDVISGAAGNDTISAREAITDVVNCGAGRDTVTADGRDTVAGNCERVARG